MPSLLWVNVVSRKLSKSVWIFWLQVSFWYSSVLYLGPLVWICDDVQLTGLWMSGVFHVCSFEEQRNLAVVLVAWQWMSWARKGQRLWSYSLLYCGQEVSSRWISPKSPPVTYHWQSTDPGFYRAATDHFCFCWRCCLSLSFYFSLHSLSSFSPRSLSLFLFHTSLSLLSLFSLFSLSNSNSSLSHSLLFLSFYFSLFSLSRMLSLSQTFPWDII